MGKTMMRSDVDSAVVKDAVEIRYYHANDLAGFTGLYQQVFPLKKITIRQIAGDLKLEPAQVLLAVAQPKNKTGSLIYKGFLYYWLVGDEFQIIDIGTQVAYRRSGIAEQILAFLIKNRGPNPLGKITLEVRADNLAAIGLYDKLGFVVVGERKRYYDDGCAALLMDKQGR